MPGIRTIKGHKYIQFLAFLIGKSEMTALICTTKHNHQNEVSIVQDILKSHGVEFSVEEEPFLWHIRLKNGSKFTIEYSENISNFKLLKADHVYIDENLPQIYLAYMHKIG